MTTYSTIAQLPLPQNTDGLVAETAFGDYANALDSLLVPQYSTTAARDAAMASGKVEGQLCAVAGELQYWDGQQWWYQGTRNVVLKGIDTARASTTTVTADPQLTIPVVAGATYYAEAWLVPLCAATTVNFRFRWGSSGGAINWGRAGLHGFAAGATVVNNTLSHVRGAAATSEVIVGAPSSTQGLVTSSVVFTTTASDTVQLFWAQGTSSATAVTLSGRSHIEYRRIG